MVKVYEYTDPIVLTCSKE
ncbi:hypothetical protein PDN54_29285 [Bacillus cereus group sp. Bc252]|nr:MULTISPECIES: hypothetical protein [Bacillus cereus group]MCU5209253.1 hypothetical protein [Bacillus paranthracis]MDA2164224.1 hypothetical protein [Bacillus cereus group sp. Bc252]MDF9512780.1 hypothetical protein [Bacillus paranthracis]MDF9672114.1 hypothetical protein [Bacillus paranthracis]MDG1611775.1 hypothetical protein [Bacillus paranthracis]